LIDSERTETKLKIIYKKATANSLIDLKEFMNLKIYFDFYIEIIDIRYNNNRISNNILWKLTHWTNNIFKRFSQ